MNKRNVFSYAILGAFLLLFFLNTVTHDYFCRDELHTVCGPLHSILTPSAPSAGEYIFTLPPLLSFLAWNYDRIPRPDFIRNIFHPPD